MKLKGIFVLLNLSRDLCPKKGDGNFKFQSSFLLQPFSLSLSLSLSLPVSFCARSLVNRSAHSHRFATKTMYSQHFVDLQGDNDFVDPKSLFSSPTLRRAQSQLSAHTSTSAATIGAAGTVDPVLYNNLVEIFPLVESLIVTSLSLTYAFYL